jgi:insecticidal toxin
MEPFELALKIKGIDGWFCNAVNTDLLLTDPDNGHTLVLRGALALNLSRQAKVSLILNVAGDYQKVDLEELINFRESSSAIELGELLVTANEV